MNDRIQRGRELLEAAVHRYPSDRAEARRQLLEAVELLGDGGDDRTRGEIALLLAMTSQPDTAAAIPHAEAALAAFRAARIPHQVRATQRFLAGLLASVPGRAAEAEQLARSVVAACTITGDRRAAAEARITHGVALAELNRTGEAVDVVVAALADLAERPHDLARRCLIGWELLLGRPDRARAHWRPDLKDARFTAAVLDLEQGELDRARVALEGVLHAGESTRWRVLLGLLRVHLATMRLDDAERVLGQMEAEDGVEDLGLMRAELWLARGDPDRARVAMEPLPAATAPPRDRAEHAAMLAEILRVKGALADADAAMAEAEQAAAEAEGPGTWASVAVRRGLLDVDLGRADAAAAIADRLQAHLDAHRIGSASELGVGLYRIRLALARQVAVPDPI